MVVLLHMLLHWFASFAFQLKRSIDPYEKAFQKHSRFTFATLQ